MTNKTRPSEIFSDGLKPWFTYRIALQQTAFLPKRRPSALFPIAVPL
ncbi:hypothetical protein NEIFL0001_0033 [Neisseria flavescens SK114]|nr:hypothetical protein NEIFL0001_0033 [Neisseria flavescens SK114]